MSLIPLKFQPGLNRELTRSSNEGGWYDMDKVRFRFGFPEKIAGWVKRSTSQKFIGRCRALISWVDLRKERYIGIGTNLKYYIDRGTTLFDITPIRQVFTKKDVVSIVVNYSAGSTGLPPLESSVADVTVSIGPINVTGVFATGSAGSIVSNTDGTPLPQGSAVVKNLDGVSASGFVGSPVGIADDIFNFYVTGVSADSSLGSVFLTTTDEEDDLTFAVVSGSREVTVTTTTEHGAVTGDFVTFSNVEPSPGGFDVATAAVVNQEYVVTKISNFQFSFKLREADKTIKDITVNGEVDQDLFPFTSTVTTTTGGGTEARAEFQENVGSNISQLFNGWNAGPWGSQGWGQTEAQASLRLWHHTTFGEDLILHYRDGPIYYWDASEDVTTRAIALTGLTGATKTPTIAKQVLVSDRDRHIIAFGCDPEFDPGVQDPLTIRFSTSDEINPDNNLRRWDTDPETTAGELRLGLGSQIVQAVETKQQILVFTDTTLYTMQFLGPPYIFGVSAVSEKITIQSPNAAVAVDDVVLWMGANEFYIYQGSVQRLPCTVRDFIFNDFNFDQSEKVIAGVNSEHSEVWWFYPSANFDSQGTYQNVDVDRYVIYNYQEQTWSVGTLNRTAWMDRGLFNFPIAAGTDGHLYEHEKGFDDGSYEPARAIPAYIESSPFDIGEGDKFMMIKKLIPDVTFKDSNSTAPYVNLALRTEQYPGAGKDALNAYNPWLRATEAMNNIAAVSILDAAANDAANRALWGPIHQAIPGRILGDITNSGYTDIPSYNDAQALDTYIKWKYLNNAVKPPSDQIDYIENYMIPYIAARPHVFVSKVQAYPELLDKQLYDNTNSTSQIYRTYRTPGQFELYPDNESFTEYVNMRLRGRSATFKVSSNELGVGWRLGTPKLEVRESGRR
jgi:hypothetical protein